MTEITTIGNVSFKTLEYLEEDDAWSALFVRVGDSAWVMAQPFYGTEDMTEICKQIKDIYVEIQ